MVKIKKLLAKPEAWNCLEESEKRVILDLLPEDLHSNLDPSPDDPGAKIPPLPEEFLRYSNNWRDGIRHFQLDLQNGRYDPVWLRQAGEAMQQRADGKFDKFKEEEFEQFWGQKQKMDKTLAAGQSSQVKLSTLISNGVVLVGDVWKYSRAFKKGNLLVEKEARVCLYPELRSESPIDPATDSGYSKWSVNIRNAPWPAGISSCSPELTLEGPTSPSHRGKRETRSRYNDYC